MDLKQLLTTSQKLVVLFFLSDKVEVQVIHGGVSVFLSEIMSTHLWLLLNLHFFH